MTSLEGYHPRAVTMVGLMGPPIRRASLVGMAAGIGGALGTGLVLGPEADGLLVAGAGALVAVVAGTSVALLAVPRRVGRAFAAFSWLGRRETVRFVETTGSRVPVGVAATQAWLEANPRAPITALARVELLVGLGRFAEARTEYLHLAAPATDEDRVARAVLRTWGEGVETGEVDFAAFDAVVAALPADSPWRLEAAVARAVAETRVLAARGDPDPLRPLVAVRPRLGREATAIVLRDTWLPFARQLLLFGALLGVVTLLFRPA